MLFLKLKYSSNKFTHLSGSFICLRLVKPSDPKKLVKLVFSGISHIAIEIIRIEFLAD